MATIYNSELSKGMQKDAGIQISKDSMPTQLAEKVVPVMEVNPRLLRRCNIVRVNAATNSASATIYTTPTNQDFYLCGATLGVIKDVTSQSLSTRLNVTIDGVVQPIMHIPSISLTVQSEVMALSFPFPVKVDRGTNITVTNSNATANITASSSITGYVDEQSLA
jgi:hypothetical protein